MLLTTERAAKLLFTTPYTVRKWIREGLLIASKVGKRYLIEEREMDRVLAKYRTQEAGGYE